MRILTDGGPIGGDFRITLRRFWRVEPLWKHILHIFADHFCFRQDRAIIQFRSGYSAKQVN